MNLGKHLQSVAVWISVLAGSSLSTASTANVVIVASPGTPQAITLDSASHQAMNPQFVASPNPANGLRLSGRGLVTQRSLVPPGNKKKHKDQAAATSVHAAFGQQDCEIIRTYYSQQNSNLPPGLAKRRGQLPPGLEKHLRRNGQLPPGLQKKIERFPDELERRLPGLPRNYVRVFVAGRGLIVDAQFNIVDIIDIFR